MLGVPTPAGPMILSAPPILAGSQVLLSFTGCDAPAIPGPLENPKAGD